MSHVHTGTTARTYIYVPGTAFLPGAFILHGRCIFGSCTGTAVQQYVVVVPECRRTSLLHESRAVHHTLKRATTYLNIMTFGCRSNF